MGAADGDGVGRGRDDLGQHFAAGADASGEGRDLGMVRRHGGCDHGRVRGGGVGRVVSAGYLHALALQPARARRERAVAAAHIEAAAL